jgi:hypothetical protein
MASVRIYFASMLLLDIQALLELPGDDSAAPMKGSNRRLEFELGAWFKARRGVTWVLAMGQMMEHGLGALGRANLHPGGNSLNRQGGFLPQPGGDGHFTRVELPNRTPPSPGEKAPRR